MGTASRERRRVDPWQECAPGLCHARVCWGAEGFRGKMFDVVLNGDEVLICGKQKRRDSRIK
jgi:hypothetical protein